jgi:hypothetical protein
VPAIGMAVGVGAYACIMWARTMTIGFADSVANAGRRRGCQRWSSQALGFTAAVSW